MSVLVFVRCALKCQAESLLGTSNLFWGGTKEMGVIEALKSSTELTNALLISHGQRITLDHFKFGCRNMKSSQSSYTEKPLSCVCTGLKAFDPTSSSKK